MMKSLFFGTDNTAASTSAVNYQYIMTTDISSANATESNRQMVMPMSGSLNNFYVTLDVAPSAGKSWTFTVRKNGADTALTLTISDASTSASDTTHSISFAAGDLLSIAITPTGTPTAFGKYYWDIECNANGQPIIGGNGSSMSNSVSNYGLLQGGSTLAWTATETDVQIICPTDGTINSMYLKTSGTPGSGTSYAMTLQKNGSDTALVATVSNLTTTGSDTSNNVSVAAGDTLTIKSTPTGTPTARGCWWGVQFTPTTNGESFIGFGSTSVPGAASTNYDQGFFAGQANANWTATEANTLGYIGPQTLKKMYVKLITAPGGAASRTFTVRKATADTALSVALTGATASGNDTDDVAFTRGESFTLKCVPASTPATATGGVHGGYLVYFTPSATRRIMIIS